MNLRSHHQSDHERSQADGNPALLPARKYTFVEVLVLRPCAVLSRAQLEKRRYGLGDEVAGNAVEKHIHSVRRKLGPDFIQKHPKAGGCSMKSPHARLSVFLLLAAVLATVVIGLIPSRHTLKENDDLFDYQWRQIAVSLREQDVVDQPVYELDGST